VWYRYEDRIYARYSYDDDTFSTGEFIVELLRYSVMRVSSRSAWLARIHQMAPEFGGKKFLGTDRRVLLGATRRFACPTLAEAKDSFVCRKTKQRSIYEAGRNRASRALALVAERYERDVVSL
jgi:hypothetical protein